MRALFPGVALALLVGGCSSVPQSRGYEAPPELCGLISRDLIGRAVAPGVEGRSGYDVNSKPAALTSWSECSWDYRTGFTSVDDDLNLRVTAVAQVVDPGDSAAEVGEEWLNRVQQGDYARRKVETLGVPAFDSDSAGQGFTFSVSNVVLTVEYGGRRNGEGLPPGEVDAVELEVAKEVIRNFPKP